jgi:hypothetical protein
MAMNGSCCPAVTSAMPFDGAPGARRGRADGNDATAPLVAGLPPKIVRRRALFCIAAACLSGPDDFFH